jgi:hypothetical protein
MAPMVLDPTSLWMRDPILIPQYVESCLFASPESLSTHASTRPDVWSDVLKAVRVAASPTCNDTHDGAAWSSSRP